MNHGIGFGLRAGMRNDRFEQVIRAAVMQEEDALAYTPQGSGAKLLSIGVALRNSVRQSVSHVVHSKVAERTERYILLVGEGGHSRRLRCHMTDLTPDVLEKPGSLAMSK